MHSLANINVLFLSCIITKDITIAISIHYTVITISVGLSSMLPILTIINGCTAAVAQWVRQFAPLAEG